MNEIYLYKNRLIFELLSGKGDYKNYSVEAANYLINILNSVVSENLGLFCFEETAYFTYKEIIDDLSDKINIDNVNKCAILLKKLLFLLNNDSLKKCYRNSFINSQLQKRKVSFENFNKIVYPFFDIKFFIYEAVKMDNAIIPAIIYKDRYLENKHLLSNILMIESSLNYFYATNPVNSNYYQNFINFYYQVYGVNLLGMAEKKILHFVLKPGYTDAPKYGDSKIIQFKSRII